VSDFDALLPTQVPLTEILTPEIEAFVGYWESLKDGAFAPSWQRFDLVALAPKSIPNIVVVDVVREPLDFVVRFWGTAHVARKGADKTGKSVNYAPEFRGQAAFEEYRWVVDNRRPLASRDIVNLQDVTGSLPFRQMLVRLPLSNDGETVDHVISLAVWERV